MDLTPRAIVALILFIFGTTFLWLTPSFAGPTTPNGGTWNLVQIVSLLTVLGFVLAAWGVWQAALPWELVAAVAAVAGLVAVGAYWLAVQDLPSAANVVPNLVLHLVGSALVLLVLVVPAAHSWLADRL